jgi:hypothetical protein
MLASLADAVMNSTATIRPNPKKGELPSGLPPAESWSGMAGDASNVIRYPGSRSSIWSVLSACPSRLPPVGLAQLKLVLPERVLNLEALESLAVLEVLTVEDATLTFDHRSQDQGVIPRLAVPVTHPQGRSLESSPAELFILNSAHDYSATSANRAGACTFMS